MTILEKNPKIRVKELHKKEEEMEKLRSLFKVFRPKKKKIRKYCGISKQPGLKREEHKKNFRSLHNWRVVVKFKNKVEAEGWRDAQEGYEKEMDGYHGEVGMAWYGYKFDY